MKDTFHVILVEPKYDGNIGSVARVMKNFGFKNLALVNPPKIGSEGRRNSMHAREIMDEAKVYGRFDDLIEEFDFLVATTAQDAGDGNVLRSPVYPEELSKAAESRGRIGLLFGREDIGLLNDELAACDMMVTIPANPEYPTMNLAMSAGVILYELGREINRKKKKTKKYRILDGDRKRVMLENWDKIVDKVYSREFENKLAKKTFRQMIGRAFISGREAQTLIGILRKTREKIR